jgi:outer membrane protein OmpA-like peptidoglycan-associated protein
MTEPARRSRSRSRFAPALALAAAATLLAACGTPSNYVVLLDSPDGRPSAVTLTTSAGQAATLNQPGTAVGVSGPGRAPGETFTPKAEEIQRTFGAALAAQPARPVTFTLNFKFNAAELTEDSQRRLPEILALFRDRPAPEAVVSGYTDAMGDPLYNFELARKRAEIVADLLAKEGIDRQRIEVVSFGASNPVVPGKPGVPEPQNRRVEVTVR